MAGVPEYIIRHVHDKRLRRLTNRVWQRLPACDRHVLRERLFCILGGLSTHPNDETVIAYAGGIHRSVMDGCAAEAVEDLPLTVDLCRASEVESDAVCMYVIAHELAHVVLRHPEMSLLVESLLGFEPEPIYTDEDAHNLYGWHEDEADLQVWLWGFRDEYKAALEAFPEGRRARWYVELEVEELDSPEAVSV